MSKRFEWVCSCVRKEQTHFSSRHRRFLRFLPIGAALLAFASCGGDSDASCAAGVEFQGSTYIGVATQQPEDVELAEDLGTGRTVTCLDDGTSDTDGEDDAAVQRIAGISPRVGIAVDESPSAVYILPGRCDGFLGWDGFWRCLHENLHMESRTYTARKLLPAEVPIPKADGEPFAAELVVDGRESVDVSVVAISGMRREVAVARSGDPATIYIEDGSCHVAKPDQLLDCLREA